MCRVKNLHMCRVKNFQKEMVYFCGISLPRMWKPFTNFLGKLSRVEDLAITKYDNVVILGDINVDTQDSNSPGLNKVQDLCGVFWSDKSYRSRALLAKPKRARRQLILLSQTALEVSKIVERLQYSTIQYNTIQYNTIQYNTIQYNTIQYNTIQYICMFIQGTTKHHKKISLNGVPVVKSVS